MICFPDLWFSHEAAYMVIVLGVHIFLHDIICTVRQDIIFITLYLNSVCCLNMPLYSNPILAFVAINMVIVELI